MISVSAIVPAHNEEKTIRRVVEDLLRVSFINEIIFVDDGSKDRSVEILKEFSKLPRLKFIFNSKNKGKGYGVACGLEVSEGKLILILDADIINYTENDLRLLIDPVLKGECDYAMKMTDDPNTKFLSGVRAYWKGDLIPLLDEMKETTRYGLEVMLNKRLIHKKGKFIALKDYKHFQKFEKYYLFRALWEYAREGASILAQKVK